MINQTADESKLEHLLITAKAEHQTLKNEEKDVVIAGESLARIYRQLIDVIGQLKTERKCNAVLREALEFYHDATQNEFRIHLGDKAFDAFEQEAEIRGEG